MIAYTKTKRLLTVDNLNLSYGGKPILRNISITVDDIVRAGVNQGQVVSLLGPSGIGKTQLFKCLAGLQPATSGSVLLNEVKSPVKAGEVGVVFQTYPLMKSRTVWGNLKLATTASGKKDEDITALLTRFDLLDKKDLYPAQLSGGQRQRIAIIQQLLCSTHFFLMDEPFSGLDIKMKNQAAQLISEVALADELNTIIITSHDIETAMRISDTIWILGFEKDASGARIPGATVIKQYDLAAMGLAWEKDVEKQPLFVSTLHEIRDMFNSF